MDDQEPATEQVGGSDAADDDDDGAGAGTWWQGPSALLDAGHSVADRPRRRGEGCLEQRRAHTRHMRRESRTAVRFSISSARHIAVLIGASTFDPSITQVTCAQ